MLEKIPGNVINNSGECSRRFRGMFQRIPENVPEDSGECLGKLWEMLSILN